MSDDNSDRKPIPGAHPKAQLDCPACGGLGWVLEPGETLDPKRKYVACECTRKQSEAGDIVIGLLVGLAIGAAMLWINSGNEAQELANASGRPVSQAEVIAEDPGKSALTLFGPAVAGAGVGWALQELSGDNNESSRDNNIRINDNSGSVNVNVRGDGGDSSSVRTDTKTDSRVNQ